MGLSALPGCSHRLSWDFPSRLARAREEGARFVSRPASGTFPRKLPEPRPKPPPLLAAPPAQSLAQARQCGDRRFVLPRMPGRSAKAPRLELPPLAPDAGLGGPVWGAHRVERSSPKGLWAPAATAQSPGVLEKGPAPLVPTQVPPFCGAGSQVPGAGRGREGRLDFWPPAWIQVKQA